MGYAISFKRRGLFERFVSHLSLFIVRRSPALL